MDKSDSSLIERMAAQLEELQGLCAQLGRDNAELRDRISALAASAPPGALTAERPATGNARGLISRRGVLGKAVGAAAVTTLGAAALVGREAAPTFAANGNVVVAGDETLAEDRTSVRYDGSSGFAGVVLLGNDSIYSGNSANYPAGVGGWAGAGSTAGSGGVKHGVYGFTDNGGGNGVVGYNSGLVSGSGAGVLGLAFASTNIAVVGTNTSGTAVSGTSGSTTSDATAIIGVISSTSPGGFSATVRAQNNGTGGLGIGVWATHAGSGWGVYATSVSGIGVLANGGSGVGVEASGAIGVSASGSTAGVSANGGSSGTGVSASGGTGVERDGQHLRGQGQRPDRYLGRGHRINRRGRDRHQHEQRPDHPGRQQRQRGRSPGDQGHWKWNPGRRRRRG